MDPNFVPIVSAVGGAVVGSVIGGAVTGLISKGANAAVIAQLRIEVNVLTASKEALSSTVASHATEIALLKQAVMRIEGSMGRIESDVTNLPSKLASLINQSH